MQSTANRGFSLIEALIGSVLFFAIAVPIYGSFIRIFDAIEVSRIKLLAVALSNEQIEIARNLPYSDVGIAGGLPVGKIPATQTLTRSGHQFTVVTTARNIDDPFDGTIGGAPNDLSPADYKLLEIRISCASCQAFKPITFTARVAPKNLETASGNGALFVQVIDANGVEVPGATVDILNQEPDPDVAITDVTDTTGWLKIIDAPPGNAVYEVTVTKTGYTSDRTYLPGAVENPNPLIPHATIVAGQVSQVTLVIDRVSTLTAASVDDACAQRGNVDFQLTGAKLMGTNPDTVKYDQALATDGSGLLTLPSVEWDVYRSVLNDATYDLAGTIPLLPLDVLPAATINYSLIVAAKNPKALLVSIKDSASQLPISDATVTLSDGGVDTVLTTGSGYRRQTDWSGGGGQNEFIDPTKYFDTDNNINRASPAGELKLADLNGAYVANGDLTSSTFDLGAATNFQRIFWEPQNQPPEAGTTSVRMQIATNLDSTTWNFLGPDGTSGSYYAVDSSNIAAIHDGDQYLRYKIFLSSDDDDYTPNVADVAFTFTSDCVPPGQAFFSGLSQGSYTITVAKAGYQPYTATVDTPSDWQETVVSLVSD